MTPQEAARREAIFQEVYQRHRACRAAELRDPDYWRNAIVHSLRMCWAAAWKGTALALYLTLLCELCFFANPPLPAFKPLFNAFLSISLTMMVLRIIVVPFRLSTKTTPVAKP